MVYFFVKDTLSPIGLVDISCCFGFNSDNVNLYDCIFRLLEYSFFLVIVCSFVKFIELCRLSFPIKIDVITILTCFYFILTFTLLLLSYYYHSYSIHVGYLIKCTWVASFTDFCVYLRFYFSIKNY